MKITLTQEELQTAATLYLQNIGLNVDLQEVDVTFASTRNPHASTVANIELKDRLLTDNERAAIILERDIKIPVTMAEDFGIGCLDRDVLKSLEIREMGELAEDDGDSEFLEVLAAMGASCVKLCGAEDKLSDKYEEDADDENEERAIDDKEATDVNENEDSAKEIETETSAAEVSTEEMQTEEVTASETTETYPEGVAEGTDTIQPSELTEELDVEVPALVSNSVFPT